METENKIEATKVKDVLKNWMEKIQERVVCGVAVLNFMKGKLLENPRYHLSSGIVVREPTKKVEENMASASIFVRKEPSVRGTSGVLCYDISGMNNKMMCIMWYLSISEKLKENRFNVSLMDKMECNEILFDMLYKKSIKAEEEEIEIETDGLIIKGNMTAEQKSLFVVEVNTTSFVESQLNKGHLVSVGRKLEEHLRQWLKVTDQRSLCAVGINNFSDCKLIFPKYHIVTGKCIFEPADEIPQRMAGPQLFSKISGSVRGTSGVLTYEIERTSLKLAVMWCIPFSETLHDNHCNVCIVPSSVNCDRDLYNMLYESRHNAKEGQVSIVDHEIKITFFMDTEGKSAFIVNFQDKRETTD